MKFALGLFVALLSGASLHATLTLKSFTANLSSPQKLGTVVTFTATAVDGTQNAVTFQFNVAFNNGAFVTVRNYNIGTHTPTGWQSQPFTWSQIQTEGTYTIQVVARDFHTGETARASLPFTLTSAVSGGSLTLLPTQNTLVALAAIPACPTGSSVRVVFRRLASQNSTRTPFVPCHGTTSSNVYLGGMYANATYSAIYQVKTGSALVTGPSTAVFTTGQVPSNVPLPEQDVVQAPTSDSYTTDDMILHDYINASPSTLVQPLATDLAGNPMWYYETNDWATLLTRPLPGGYFFTLEAGTDWATRTSQILQVVRRVDLTGNIIQESNVGLMQQQLLNMGATDLQSCANIPIPAPVGSACLTSLSHDAILLPNGNIAVIGAMEKIFPPGTQGDQSGLNVDILGDAIIVLDNNLNVIWFWDAFQHDGGGTQLDINRRAVLGETCAPNVAGCPVLYLVGSPGVTTIANDWMHSNSLFYNPANGDFLMSVRHQDWVLKVDYANGAGTNNIDYRLGPDGDFTFNNINNDPYPWFSHQHDAGLEVQNNAFDCFDNGNTRISVEGGGNSRGMALSVDLGSMTVTPLLSQDVGYYAFALGSAQLLENGNYHFQPGIVTANTFDYSFEYTPVPGTTQGTLVFGLASNSYSYRSFRVPDLYSPPTT